MLRNFHRLFSGLAVMIIGVTMHTTALCDESPVSITLDDHSARTDILSDKKVPKEIKAQRGSIRFHFGRIDKPEKGFGYFFDGRNYQETKGLALIRKMSKLGAWAILGGRGWQGAAIQPVRTNPLTICEIEHHAVSFLPIDEKTGKIGDRVYLMLDDIYKIQWRKVDHWISTMTQKELDDAHGTMY